MLAQMNLKYLQKIRLAEMESVMNILKEVNSGKKSVLEIGAGTGWQAQKFSEHGYDIKAIDIEASNYLEDRVWPVLDYDGKHVPFPNESFDIVYSSSVLEHIPHVQKFQFEIKRVLKPDGVAIHLVPTASWRIWTIFTYYFRMIKIIMILIKNKIKPKKTSQSRSSVTTSKTPMTTLAKKAVFPLRHGERGNSISEIYYFSRWGWYKIFEKGGWKVAKRYSGRLFYTGSMLFASLLPVTVRKWLSHIFGSSCHIFVLQKEEKVSQDTGL